MEANEVLVERLKNAAVERDGQMTLSCHAAFQIADGLSARIAEIGALCNELNIKITHCQLGCFK